MKLYIIVYVVNRFNFPDLWKRLYTNSALPPGGPRTPSHDVRWGEDAHDDALNPASDDIMRK